ncbi:nucleotidyl transferase AbiEii/AbiGii toxin family protein [Candidatus Curtissbacteria bacterium]|nr:nucleotidyl transferase AbiEii/AbiGii toxin family protein [Candidatus Curtissbacteria bacterium]
MIEGITVANLQDIAAMKLVAVSHRPVKRDYIDVFFLLEKFTLEEMFGFVTRKYPKFNQYFTIRALTYFEDIKDDEKQRAIKILDHTFSWDAAKKKIFEEVKKYQLAMIRK